MVDAVFFFATPDGEEPGGCPDHFFFGGLRKSSRQQWHPGENIRQAVKAGSRARDTDDGSRVLGLRRGRGAYALLQRADGSVTRAGEAYFGMLGRQPESSDLKAREVRATAERAAGPSAGRHLPADEPREAVLQVLAARSTHPSGHKGNAAGRQKRGPAYERRDWLPANVLGGEASRPQKRQRSKSILHFTCLPLVLTLTARCSWLSSSVRAALAKMLLLQGVY